VTTRAFLGEEGRLTGIRASEVDWVRKDSEGPVVPQERPGTEFEVQADLVLLAMGFVGPRKGGLLDTLDLERDERGNVRVHGDNATSRPGVYTAGDMNLGPSLVVRALADGRKAARGIVEYLSLSRRR
jgi:glutamate synthase (NADPH/NADH) small chain